MHVSLVGINHQTTPITIREKMAISTEKLYDSLSLILRNPIRCLKTNMNNNDYAEMVNKLFQLDRAERG